MRSTNSMANDTANVRLRISAKLVRSNSRWCCKTRTFAGQRACVAVHQSSLGHHLLPMSEDDAAGAQALVSLKVPEDGTDKLVGWIADAKLPKTFLHNLNRIGVHEPGDMGLMSPVCTRVEIIDAGILSSIIASLSVALIYHTQAQVHTFCSDIKMIDGNKFRTHWQLSFESPTSKTSCISKPEAELETKVSGESQEPFINSSSAFSRAGICLHFVDYLGILLTYCCQIYAKPLATRSRKSGKWHSTFDNN